MLKARSHSCTSAAVTPASWKWVAFQPGTHVDLHFQKPDKFLSKIIIYILMEKSDSAGGLSLLLQGLSSQTFIRFVPATTGGYHYLIIRRLGWTAQSLLHTSASCHRGNFSHNNILCSTNVSLSRCNGARTSDHVWNMEEKKYRSPPNCDTVILR